MIFQFTRLSAIFLLLQCVTIAAYAQDSCYNCNRDSIIRQLPLVKTDAEKIKALSIIIDFSPTADSANYYIGQLIQLNKNHHLVDEAAYKKIAEANNFYLKKEYRSALESYKNAVGLFDKKGKKIAALLLGFRNIFNLLNTQEERYEYYKGKLNYYLINGPYENTSACYHGVGGYYTYTADYNQAISFYLKGAEVFKKFYPYWHYNALGIVGVYYAEWGNEKKAWEYFNYALPILDSLRFLSPTTERNKAFYDVALSRLRLKEKNYKKAMQHADFVINDFKQNSTNRFYAIGLLLKALVFISTNEPTQAYPLLKDAKKLSDSLYNGRMTTFNSTLEIDYGLYKYFILVKDYKSAETYLLQAYKRAVEETSNEFQLKYLKELSTFYLTQGQLSLGKKYITEYFALKEKIEEAQSNFKVAQYENEKKQLDQLQNINDLKKERAVQEAAISKRDTILFISLVSLLLIGISMIFLYRQLEINKRNLKSLKTTQSQLIQSEKMASLGELTAGIAHEIQNPLNFVNNFSEVSTELLDEMITELANNNKEDAIAIADDVKHNLEKILHHGKQADGIVKGMLQHSRSRSAVKEPTDINKLADEYLRLVFHGLRAKDKDFNAILKTDYDETIGNINVIPQDIGRVILNLITNAFYAVTEKRKEQKDGYEPAVSVRTKKIADKVEIRVGDNGNGIPQHVVDKYFNPSLLQNQQDRELV
jgi:signal transduction histidine kinase